MAHIYYQLFSIFCATLMLFGCIVNDNTLTKPSFTNGIAERIEGVSILIDKRPNDADLLQFRSTLLNIYGMELERESEGNREQSTKFYMLAVDDLSKAISLRVDNVEAIGQRGEVYCHLNQYDLAINDFSEAIRLSPNYARLYLGRARAYYDNKQFDRATSDFVAAIKIDHLSEEAYIGLVWTLRDSGRYKEALSYIQLLKKIFPENSYFDKDLPKLSAKAKFQHQVDANLMASDTNVVQSSYTSPPIINELEPKSNSIKGIALVIGNAHYKSNPLNNTLNDAEAMHHALSKLGYKVILHKDLCIADMRKHVSEFCLESREYDIRVFYYSGHGIQYNGFNYLIPIDATLASEKLLELETVNANLILNALDAEGKTNKANIMILDACRTNPFPKLVRSLANGLAPMDAPVGTIIGFSTAPGRTASDGEIGKLGLYTGELVKHIMTPNLIIEDVFKRIRHEVKIKSKGAQVPWEATSLTGSFYFNQQ